MFFPVACPGSRRVRGVPSRLLDPGAFDFAGVEARLELPDQLDLSGLARNFSVEFVPVQFGQ